MNGICSYMCGEATLLLRVTSSSEFSLNFTAQWTNGGGGEEDQGMKVNH